MRHLQTPPHPSHEAGSMLATVKVEDGWAQSPPVPASCQLSRQGYSSYSTGDNREVRVPRWGPMTLGKFWVIYPHIPMGMSSKAHKYLLLFQLRILFPASPPKLLHCSPCS